MDLQGMGFPRLDPGIHVTITEVDEALENASPVPISVDARLWTDWLRFLEGGSTNGGILVR
jgi:hypothetical protein